VIGGVFILAGQIVGQNYFNKLATPNNSLCQSAPYFLILLKLKITGNEEYA